MTDPARDSDLGGQVGRPVTDPARDGDLGGPVGRPVTDPGAQNLNRVMSFGNEDHANAFTGSNSHNPPSVQFDAEAS